MRRVLFFGFVPFELAFAIFALVAVVPFFMLGSWVAGREDPFETNYDCWFDYFIQPIITGWHTI